MGAAFGAVVRFGWAAYAIESHKPVWFWVVCGAGVFGTLAAWLGDDFWHNITHWT